MNDETIGDLGCPSVDVEQWQQTNRVPLFTAMRNRWVLRHKPREARSFAEVQSLALEHLRDWLGEPARELTVERISSDPIELEPAIATYRTLKEPLLTLPDSTKYVWLVVSFRWDSPTSSLGWFVRNDSGVLSFPATKRCPVDPDWFLDSVGQAQATTAPELEGPEQAKAPSVHFDVFPKKDSPFGHGLGVLASVAAGLAAGWLYLRLKNDGTSSMGGRGRGG